jgi:hypothetical protein
MLMLRSEQTNEIAAALAKAQAQIKMPAKTKTARVKMRAEKGGGEYTFNYADLTDVIEAVRGPLSAAGIAFSHCITSDDKGLLLETTLLHESGQFISTIYPLDLNATAQANGSEITYAKRYSLSMLCGVSAEEDDDGNAASGNEREISPRNKPAPRAKKPEPQPQAEMPSDLTEPLMNNDNFKTAISDAFKARGFTKPQLLKALGSWREANSLGDVMQAPRALRVRLIGLIGDGTFDNFKVVNEEPVGAANEA